ncbi:CBM 14 domain containing protein [Trichuris trichiura]|uniref:CBM 14 domain containing protein n=1 Tax=Trichuris trichiura TaxID=36087 RepID=A0A077Z111_TRITR|nr:CBM 14 domain containing protein [Trichuris trichiura]
MWLLLTFALLVSGDRFFDDFDDPPFRPSKHRELTVYGPPKSRSREEYAKPDSICLGKEDGSYSIGRCKSKFVSCSGGLPSWQLCPEDLVFDEHLQRCEVASQSPHCTGGRVRPTPPTSPVPTRPQRKVHFSCSHKKDGLYADRKHPCQPHYYSCSSGIATAMRCPDGLYFDPETEMCDRHNSIPACTGRPREEKKPVAIKSSYKRPKPVKFDCRGKPSGDYANPWAKRPFCSMIYYTCSNGIAMERKCPYPLFFDHKRDECNRFEKIFACTGRHYVEKPVRKPIKKPARVPVPYDCAYKKDGYYVNPKAKCSAVYYACVGSVAHKLQCQYGLAFDPESQSCQQPSHVRICGGRPVPPTKPTKPPQKPVSKRPVLDCSDLRDGLYPDPLRKCSRIFYSCTNGRTVRMECPPALAYDKKSMSCQLASELFVCTGRRVVSRKPYVPSKEPIRRKPVPFDCSRRDDGLYPNPKHICSPFYYACSNGIASKLDCPRGLFYDPKRGVCDSYADIYLCSGQRRPKTPTPVYHRVIKPSIEFDCTGRPTGLYPVSEKACSRYFYQCSNDLAYKVECSRGSYFDPAYRRCDRYERIYVCSGHHQPVYRPRVQKRPHRPEYEKIPINCVEMGDGDFPEPNVRYGRVYYSCSNGKGARRHCPKGTFFHAKLRRCESEESLRYKYAKTPRPRWYKTVIDGVCAQRPDGNYPVDKCSPKFVTCSGGVATKQLCPVDLYFDIERLVCDYDERIPACGGQRPKPYVQRREKQRPSYPPVRFDCTKLPDGNYASAACSADYYVCSGGLARKERCPQQLVFSKEVDTCDYEYNVPSCGRREKSRPSKQEESNDGDY